MSRFRIPLVFAGLLGAVATLTGCLLIAGEFQTLTLTFATQRTVDAGETLEVHSAVYPNKIQLKRFFVRIAGRLIVAEGSEMPTSIEVSAVNEDLDTGRVLLRFKVAVAVAEDGTFSAVKRYKKDIVAGTLQTISVTPSGAGIPNGSQITVCVDVAKSSAELAGRPCDSTEPAPGGGTLFTVKILDNSFEPKLLRIQPGDTVRWILEGNSANHTTTEMETIWDSGFNLTRNGATYEWTPTEAHRDQTFGYACVTHQGCCQMTGSIQVGNNAPDPGDGY